MAKQSKIEWLDGGATWNPWYGCTEVSAGCKHCYARAWAKRAGYPWKPAQAKPGTLRAPLHWKEPRKVFVCSLSDFWHPAADTWRAGAWDVIQRCPQHTFMLLTKRPDRLTNDTVPLGGIPSNCWLGVTVESQEEIWRIDYILQWDAPVHFVSCEPLLGRVDLPARHLKWSALDWVIIGGESGPGCRPMDLRYAADLVRQCKQPGRWDVPVFLKQLGGYPDPQAGKAAMLAGQTYKEYPDVA